MNRTEHELLQGAQAFTEDSLAEIYERWSPELYRYAMRLLGDAGLSEECVADTFQRFLTALQQGSGPRDYLRAYLYRSAHNWITDHYRRRSFQSLELTPDLPADPQQEPHNLAAENLERRQIRTALGRLTPDQRQVITLKFLQDWDNDEIARALNKPVGAIKSLQHRALTTLKALLNPKEDELE